MAIKKKTVTVLKNVYVTSDKTEFDTELEALVHEEKIKLRKMLTNLDTDVIVAQRGWEQFNNELYTDLAIIGKLAETIMDAQKKIDILNKM
jgi:hydrogenase maturation factor